MLFLYIVIAVFIAWIWVDYYRLIDIYEKENLWHFALTFLLGCASVGIVYGLNHFVLSPLAFHLTGDFLLDFLYCVFNIGLVEELAKAIPFVIIYYFFKDHINEPIDYVIYFSISALGFSATENILYFQQHGPHIINNRAILSTVGHMFDSALIAYGVILYKYYHKNTRKLMLPLFLLLAALAHGFYDFWLLFEGTKGFGWLLTVVFFFITISLFSAILNNALNNSGHFTYKKMVDPNRVAGRLLLYYAIVFLVQFAFLSYLENVERAMWNMVSSLYFSGFIIFVTVIRLSRFKLIQHRWEQLRPAFPFSIYYTGYTAANSTYRLKIEGDSYNEVYLNNFYEEYFYLNPLAPPSNYLVRSRLAFIENKLFLKDDETFYVVRVYVKDENGPSETMLLKAKTSGSTMVKGTYPIVALLKIRNPADLKNTAATTRHFDFQEWAFLKPIQ